MALEGTKEQATIDDQIVSMGGGPIILLEKRVLIFNTKFS
jgi:hypothetical protein